MKKSIYLGMLAAALCATSCDKEEGMNQTTDESKRVAVRFTSNTATITTKAWDSFYKQMGIYMMDEDGNLLEDSKNRQYAVDSDGNCTPEDKEETLYFPTDNSPVRFRAYSGGSVGEDGKIVSNLDKAATADNLDILATSSDSEAKTYTQESPNVTLALKHQLCNVQMRVYPATGKNAELEDMTISLNNLPTKAVYDPETGTVTGEEPGERKIWATPSRSGSTITFVTGMTAACPGTPGNGEVVFTLADGTVYRAQFPSGTEFKAGHILSLEVTLNDGIKATVTATSEEWDNSDPSIPLNEVTKD